MFQASLCQSSGAQTVCYYIRFSALDVLAGVFRSGEAGRVHCVENGIRLVEGLLTACEFASCQQTCMTYTIAVCTLKNLRWTEELPETCGVLFKK